MFKSQTVQWHYRKSGSKFIVVRNIYHALILTTGLFYLTVGPQPIDLECGHVADAAMTIFQYTCTVTPGDGQQDALVCTVDSVPFQPCEFPLSKVLQEFSSKRV